MRGIGNNWTPVNIGLTNTNVYALAENGENLYAGTDGGVFFSNNNGGTWFPVNTGLSNLLVRSLLVNESHLFAGTLGGLFKSSNNGNTWNLVDGDLSNLTINSLISLEGDVFAATNAGVFLTNDNGDSWTSINTGLTNLNGVSWYAYGLWGSIPQNKNILSLAVSGTNIFAGTNGGGVFLSTDHGENWQQVNSGLEKFIVKSLALDWNYIYAGTIGGSVWKRQLTEMMSIDDPTQSLNIETQDNNVSIYPNPSNGMVNITMNKIKGNSINISVTNVLGNVIKKINIDNPQNNLNQEINLMDIGKGVYFITIQTDNTREVKPIILK